MIRTYVRRLNVNGVAHPIGNCLHTHPVVGARIWSTNRLCMGCSLVTGVVGSEVQVHSTAAYPFRNLDPNRSEVPILVRQNSQLWLDHPRHQ